MSTQEKNTEEKSCCKGAGHKDKACCNHSHGGNMVFMVVGVLIVAAIVALAFVSNTVIPSSASDNNQQELIGEDMASTQTASGTEETQVVATETTEAAAPEAVTVKEEKLEIKDGNPIVAKMGKEDITRDDVLKFIAQLPPQMRQQPIESLFPMALEQTINAKLLEREAEKSDISSQDDVKEMVKDAEKNIIRTAYVQNLVEQGVSDAMIEAEYKKYSETFSGDEEIRARHILVETEDEAKALIKQLDEGASFEELAKEHSTGPTGVNGGDLGYFGKGQMVPEFSDAAFALQVGEYTKTPVKTQFGWHVIKLEDRRTTAPMSMDEARPYIETELKRDYLDKKLQDLRQAQDIKTFDINGDPIKAAGAAPSTENNG